MDTSPQVFCTTDKNYSLTIEGKLMEKLLKICRGSDGKETGGILIGYYNPNHDNAIVTDVSSPPTDSKRGPTSFIRGIRGLQSWLNRLWKRQRHYYLGEWHFHPFADPTPSMTDIGQLKKFSKTPSLRCPEPVMLIIGDDPNRKWTAKAFVSPRESTLLEMMQSNEESSHTIEKR